MDTPCEQTREIIINLYQTRFLREHIGLMARPDICPAFEFLVWLKTNHSTVLDFSHSKDDVFDTLRLWLGLYQGDQNQNP